MKVVKIAAPILLIAITLLIYLAPIGPMPGMFIGGIDTDVPVDWGDTSSIHEIKLEVASAIPRVVIIWVVQVEGKLHVVGAKDSGWVKTIGQDGPVRMRMNDKTYAMNATALTSDWEPILEAYRDKYRADYPDIVNSFPSLEEARGTTAVFRLAGP